MRRKIILVLPILLLLGCKRDIDTSALENDYESLRESYYDLKQRNDLLVRMVDDYKEALTACRLNE